MDGLFRAMIALTGGIAARFMFARYLLASLCALAVDMLLFLALSHLGAPPVAAAFGGYAGGLAVHWAISVRFVFAVGCDVSYAQRLGFVASALLGMAITMAIVGGLAAIGTVPAVAKILSVPVSFFAVYAMRKYGVFARA
ncbi:MAG: GtrA family protein [Sphingobium sp.]